MSHSGNIFISYSWHDAVHAHRVPSLLRSLGYKPWIDYENLNLRLSLEPQLNEAISDSKYVLFCESRSARASGWVQLELKIARELGKPIISSKLDHLHNNGLQRTLRFATRP